MDYTNGIGKWNLNSFPFTLPSTIFEHITSIALSLHPTGALDGLYWNLTRDGIFSLKYAYNSLTPSSPDDQNMLWLWKTACNQRGKIFVWKCNNKGISTAVRLNKANILPSPKRSLYQTQNETVRHVLRDCSKVNPIWSILPAPPKKKLFP